MSLDLNNVEFTEKILKRFWSKVDKCGENECWEWTAYITKRGYGQFSIKDWDGGAHRISYIIHNGAIIDNLLVRHSCNNLKCVNPNHLFLGSAIDDVRDLNSIKWTNKIIERFWSKVNKLGENDCWEWIAGTIPDGYGNMRINGNMYLAHRVSYVLHNGFVSDELCVCHRCDNPKCVNPDHLFLGLHEDNMHDKVKKKRDLNNRKVKEEDILQIRYLCKIGYKPSRLSLLYKLSIKQIYNIINYVNWKHVA